MLMDYFLSLKYNPQQLEAALNRCRIDLQVLALSDIVSADGRLLITPTHSGNKVLDRRSTLSWPTQEKPPLSDWVIWELALQGLHHFGTLVKPLAEWTSPSHQSWFWFMDPLTSILYFHPNISDWFAATPLHHEP
jgi:hypothetical protein